MEIRDLAVVGFGDLGERLAARLHPARWRCHGLRRNAHAVPAAVRGVAVDLAEPASLQVLQRIAPDVLLVTLSPADRSEEGYRRGFDGAMATILDGLGEHRPSQAYFISSTRVYAESEGGWVDEGSALAEDDPYAHAIIDAEQRLLAHIPGSVILRAGGLYGHGPGPLLKRVAAGRLTPPLPPRYGNRIHRDDVAGFLDYCLDRPVAEDVINLVDNGPATLQEVEEWLCRGLGMAYTPPEPDPGTAIPGHKRIRNDRLRATGYELQYGDYRAGYAEVLHRWMAHSEREDGLDLH